jgi:carboxymethylenebutenolidase
MKKFLTILLVVGIAKVQAQKSCCMQPGATESFAMLGGNRAFVAGHEDPLPFTLTNHKGIDISFKTTDGKSGGGYEIGNEGKNENVIFVIHEWWGLNDYIKQEAEHIAKETGARVIAIDLYDKKVAATKDSASKYMGGIKTQRAEAIIKGALNYVGKTAKIATIGWCFGGGWALQAAILAGTQAKACIMYYGMPEEKLDRLKTLNAPVFFVGAYKDQWISPEVIAKFEENMKAVGKQITVRSYEADHAFANPSNPNYSKVYADDAFKNVKVFLQENLN